MKRYEMTEAQYEALLEASQPVRYMVFGGQAPSSPQENANAAWRRLGKEMGFDYMSVRPIAGQPDTVFEANPTNE